MGRLAALLAPALMLLSPAVDAEDALPTAEAIRARITAAGGPPVRTYRRTIVTVSSNGTTTTSTHLQRGDDYRDVTVVGPLHSERGTVRDQEWHQNENGQTVIEQPEPDNAVVEPVTTTVGRVRTPADAYVIATLTSAGFGTKDYVDPSSWKLVRRETIGPNGTIATVFDDVREDHGITFAHHWHTEDGYTRTSTDARVTAYEAGTVTEADVAVPSSRRRLVQFPDGVRAVALPARFGRVHVIVRVMVGNRGLDFLLDTGASGIFLDSAVAEELHLSRYAQRSAVTAGRYTTAQAIVPEMRVGSLVMRDVAVHLVPQGWDELDGVKSVGLLGFDFLAELGVTIDYEHQQVVVVPEALFKPPNDAETTALDVRLGTGQPLTTVTLNGVVADRFLLDTGGSGHLMIFDYFARRHPEVMRDQGAGARTRPTLIGGIGGVFATLPYQLAHLQIGDIWFRNFMAYRVVSPGAYTSPTDGLLGPEFFRMFTLSLDYARSRVYLEPNAAGRAAMGVK